MTRSFIVAALAVADGPADAVGVVQLACEDDALALTLLRAGAYRRGFIPGSLAEAVTVHVPYGAVRGLVRRGRALVLSLDRSVPMPFHRFALARFTDDPAETLAPIHRAHRAASTLAWAIPGPIGALAAALPSADLVGGALGRASVALLVALLTGAAMRGLAAWLAWGGPVSDRHREAFEEAMSARLGLLPSPRALAEAASARARRPRASAVQDAASVHTADTPGATPPLAPAPPGALPSGALAAGTLAPDAPASAVNLAANPAANPAPPAPRPPPIPGPPVIDLTQVEAPAVPWARLVGLAGVAALGVVLALLIVRRFGTTTAPPAASELDDTVSASRAPPPQRPEEPAIPPAPPEERCFCERADSSLWRGGIPVLTVMTTTGPDGPHAPPTSKLDDHGDPWFSYDVVVVNNGAASIRETRVVLTYARRDEQNRRVGVTDRGLYWGLPLAPGASVKWTTEGPGTEVRIDKSELGTLEERAMEPAPADAFFALVRKKHHVVRLHAALMLAYHADARAIEALDAAGAPMASEATMARRIRAAVTPVIACDVKTEAGVLSMCLFNASTKPGEGLSVREIQDDETKPARAWPVAPAVPVHDGVRRSWPIEGEAPGDLIVSEGG